MYLVTFYEDDILPYSLGFLGMVCCAVGSILAVVEALGAHLNPDDANQATCFSF
jgi:hypothetical protein